ncbi:MAG: UTP--glucose-1-phosphate uridylyltransferase [Candidatus Gribaldobacteria bacterium]|nr:UTP--glucose-1-phosphate uridylyltransferase [Candidatus Gribaldobacteria bacterium]
MEIKKAVIPAAGLSTRFLPLTKIMPKQLLPVGDKAMIEHVVLEAVEAEMAQVIFVLSETQKSILEYFKSKPKLESFLEARGQKEILEKLKQHDAVFTQVTLSAVQQLLPKGDGDAVLRAKNQVAKEAFAVLFSDDLFLAKVPAIEQMKQVFLTAQKPIIGLKRVAPEKVSSYGCVKVEKIANRLYKIKEIVEKPALNEAPSDLAICGRYIFTPDIFHYLDKVIPNKKGEVILADALRGMLEDGKIIYGYDIEGDWLECGKTVDWLKSNIQVCLDHPEYGPALKEWVKNLR